MVDLNHVGRTAKGSAGIGLWFHPLRNEENLAVSQQKTQVMRLKKDRRLCSRSVGFSQHVEKHASKPFATRFFKSICTHWSKSTDQDQAA